MSVLLVVNTPPYGSEGPYKPSASPTRSPCAASTSRSFLMGDAVARGEGRPGPAGGARVAGADAHRPAGEGRRRELLRHLLRRRAGSREDQLVAHARVATIHDLAEATVRNDRVVSF